MKAFRIFFQVAAFTACNLVSQAAPYHISSRVPVPGDGGFDFLHVDPVARRIYLSHGTKVDVLDADRHQIIGEISGLSGVHGITTVPGTNRGFITNGGTKSVIVFDTQTLKKTGEVPAGQKPDAIIYDPVSKRVLAFNNGDGSVTVIDPVAAKGIGTIQVGGALEIAVADGKGNVFVNVEDSSSIVRIDPLKMEVTARWPLGEAEEPTGLGFDPKTRRLFAGCGNKLLAVVDADSGRVIATLPIGGGTDGTEFDPHTGNIFSSCSEGFLTIIHQDSPDMYRVVQNLVTQERSKTLTLDPKTGQVYLPSVRYGPVPSATPATPKPRPPIVLGSFELLVVSK